MPFTALSALLALALLALDQWVKRYITLTLPLGETRPLLPGFVELKTIHNYGAAWGTFWTVRAWATWWTCSTSSLSTTLSSTWRTCASSPAASWG